MNRSQMRCTRRLHRLQSVLRYIESHCGDSIDVSALASMASISPFHFHRVFSSHVGEPVLAYIRRLRLEKAAWQILFLDHSVTEVAAQAGYSSSAAFTRAFRTRFGTTPGRFVRAIIDARRGRPPISAGPTMAPQFRHIPELQVVGVRSVGAYDRAPRRAWTSLRRHLPGAVQAMESCLRIGIPLDWPEVTPGDRCRYEACVAIDQAPEGQLFRKQVGGGSYAVFTHLGPYRDLPGAHDAIYWHWLPRAGVTLRPEPPLHLYREPEDARFQPPGVILTEICVPVEAIQSPRIELRDAPAVALTVSAGQAGYP